MTHKIIKDIKERVQSEVEEAMKVINYYESFDRAENIYVTLQYPCGTIEIEGAVNEPWEVWIDNDTCHPLPNLHEAILQALPPYEFDFDEARERYEREDTDQDMSYLEGQFWVTRY